MNMNSLIEDEESFLYEEDKMGMSTTSGIVKITKDEGNMIGISIGGGGPYCPCVYLIQIFDNTPAWRSGVLEAGDEIVAVNGECVKGKSKKEVAKMIQDSEKEVTIKYNKLHSQGKEDKKNLDIILKKVKHRIVENMSSSTADALGLSRAILCNDSLSKKMEDLDRIEFTHKGIVENMRSLLKGNLDVCHVYKAFGDVFSEIGVKEQSAEANSSFSKFADQHRAIEKKGIEMLKRVKTVLMDFCTFLYKILPDTKLTVKKYTDTKFEYLSYCLKVKEMDDEEINFQAMQEPLYRVETGNYEYRLVLRCRQQARAKFAQMRQDVLIKLELLEQKHLQILGQQLQYLMRELSRFYEESQLILKDAKLFPIEIDLPKTSLELQQEQTLISPFTHEDEDKDEDEKNDGEIESDLLAEFNEFKLKDEQLNKQTDEADETNLINF